MRGPRDRRRTKNRPLNAFVENGVLTIEIGVETLAWSALHGSDEEPTVVNPMRLRKDSYVITNNEGFARDVACSLLSEAEDGSSMLTELFDKAIQEAIDDGAEHFEPIEPESDK